MLLKSFDLNLLLLNSNSDFDLNKTSSFFFSNSKEKVYYSDEFFPEYKKPAEYNNIAFKSKFIDNSNDKYYDNFYC